jgi:1-hydroxycarotenoid 3,4-desaturase
MIRAHRRRYGRTHRPMGWRGLGVLAQLGPDAQPVGSSWDTSSAIPRLRQSFARYATYCGSAPWRAPATLMLIAQVEMDGVWWVRRRHGRPWPKHLARVASAAGGGVMRYHGC